MTDIEGDTGVTAVAQAENSRFGRDGADFLRQLKEIGYFDAPGATVSFEMRSVAGGAPKESLDRFVEVYRSAMRESLD